MKKTHLQIKVKQIRQDNVAQIHQEQYEQFLFDKSDFVLIDGVRIETTGDRLKLALSLNDNYQPIIETSDTLKGRKIDELFFIKKQLYFISRSEKPIIDEEVMQLEIWTDFLQKREKELDTKGTTTTSEVEYNNFKELIKDEQAQEMIYKILRKKNLINEELKSSRNDTILYKSIKVLKKRGYFYSVSSEVLHKLINKEFGCKAKITTFNNADEKDMLNNVPYYKRNNTEWIKNIDYY